MTTVLTAVPASDTVDELGEGPRRDPRTGELLWVDIPAGTVHRGHRAGERIARTATYQVGTAAGGMVGAVAPLPDPGAGWLVAAHDAICHLAEDGTVRVLSRPEARRGTRFNDGACDPQGRFWIGSMGRPPQHGSGRLLRVELDGSVTTVLTSVTIANGIGWSPDGRQTYFIDTATRRLDVLSLGPRGEATELRTLVVFPSEHGVPDGLDVDEEGCVWVALWDGWAVHRYSPRGELLTVVETPVRRPTACCFLGDTLVITTARDGLTDADLRAQPDAGKLLTAKVGVHAPAARPYLGHDLLDHVCP
ncbi:SMP-30/gluconolactonase/LRE family protein [Streptomyces sp. NPDC051976]|uniref:SMP-30/gluconolactonase/LRE family protein n=1 Tax=Streptomyces sp. NPDC051976 TaxID=3154947 RepID=UPI00344040BF